MTKGGGWGAKPYDGENAWSSMNHSILYVLYNQTSNKVVFVLVQATHSQRPGFFAQKTIHREASFSKEQKDLPAYLAHLSSCHYFLKVAL
jgi:hypothetical protein